MANTVPTQERVVDPFASYNSNVVNRITEIVTHNDEGMLTANSLQVTIDSTSPTTTVVVGTGYAIKDDVLIRITAEHSVDFTDDDNWVTPPNWVTFTGGICYLVLDYVYLKQRPAPQASIKILQPTERNLILGSSSIYLLLKVVQLNTSSPFNILNLYDSDPQSGYTSNERPYIKFYAGSVVNLPTHSQTTDQGRIAYETARDRFYFGHTNEWRELTAGGVSIDVNTDTTGVSLNSLCYVDSNEQAQLAISTGVYTQAEFVTTDIGTVAASTGRGIIAGYVEDIPIESSITITAGDVLYLSATEAGKVTNVRPTTYYQIVGRALVDSTSSIDMIFIPRSLLSTDHSELTNLDYASSGHTGFAECPHDNTCHLEVYITSAGVTYENLDANGDVGDSTGQVAIGVHTHVEGDPHDYHDVPSGSIILFEADTSITGYTLLTGVDDGIVYITKGSGAGGEAGGTAKSGGTWTQTAHSHTINSESSHVHAGPSHTHPAGSHVHSTSDHALTINEMPQHYHYVAWYGVANDYLDSASEAVATNGNMGNDYDLNGTSNTPNVGFTNNTGAGAVHNHGNTGSGSGATGAGGTGNTSSGGAHDHGGNTVSTSPPNSWRPVGRNYTRQQRH